MPVNRKRILRDYRTDRPDMQVRVMVAYSSGTVCERGYWLHIYPHTVINGVSFTVLGDGAKMLLASAERLSKRGMDDAAWKAERLLLRDDPYVRKQIAKCGNVQKEGADAVPNL